MRTADRLEWIKELVRVAVLAHDGAGAAMVCDDATLAPYRDDLGRLTALVEVGVLHGWTDSSGALLAEPDAPLAPGDVVQLKSDGPLMTVRDDPSSELASPQDIAAARVLAAWLEWPGDDVRGSMMRLIGAELEELELIEFDDGRARLADKGFDLLRVLRTPDAKLEVRALRAPVDVEAEVAALGHAAHRASGSLYDQCERGVCSTLRPHVERAARLARENDALRAEIEAAEATHDDEEAAHQETLDLLDDARAEVERLKRELGEARRPKPAEPSSTSALVAEARALCAAATPGPWMINRCDLDSGWINWQVQQDGPPGDVLANLSDGEVEQARASAALIARARTLIPEMADALEGLVREREDVRRAVDAAQDGRGRP